MWDSYHEHEKSSSIIYLGICSFNCPMWTLKKIAQEKEGTIGGELSRELWKKRDLSIRKSFTFFWKKVWCVSLCGQFFQCGLIVSNNGDGKELFFYHHWSFAWGTLKVCNEIIVLEARVELPIIEHVSIIKHFSILSSFLNQIEKKLCRWPCKLEGYKFSTSIINKGKL